MKDVVVGIDLGTTFSAVAYVDDHGDPRVIPNADGKTTTPSAVLIDGGQIVVGDVALNQAITRQDNVIRWLKRRMGDNAYRFQGLSVVEISAEILKVLKGDAELHVGAPVRDAVITCPAYFSGLEIENTKRAGEMAGLRVKEIVKEPTAAAVHYGVEHMRDGETILVCDLGGGTFDATVLSYEGGVFRPKASMGDRQLGGHEWTMDLVDLVSEHFAQTKNEDPRDDLVASEMLYEACERAKRDFARVNEATIPCRIGGRIESLTVPREQFEAKSSDRIFTVVSWSEQAVHKAHMEWREISKVLLVGGSSRLCQLGPALEKASGKQAVQVREPDLAVVLGAAIIARGEVRRRRAGGLVDGPRGGLVAVPTARILERHLGTRVFAFDGGTPRIANTVVLSRGTELPVRADKHFSVSADDQKVFDVPIVEFEDEADGDIEVFHNFRFSLAGAKEGDRIALTFEQDISGIPNVTAVHERLRTPLPVDWLPYQEPDLAELTRARVQARWVVFAVDTSASMNGIKMESAKRAVIDNARSLLAVPGSGCKVGVVRFDTDVAIICHPTSDLVEVERTVARMHTGGTTHMDDGIRQAVELVLPAPEGATRDVVMVTDGQPDGDRRQNTISAARWAQSHGVTLSTVGIGFAGVDLNFLNELTPLSLVIDQVGQGQLSETMMTLLTRTAGARGLVEPPSEDV